MKALQENAEERLNNLPGITPIGGRVAEEINPYNFKYIDIVYLYSPTSTRGFSFHGYEMLYTDYGDVDFLANFCAISYSYEELTVIQTDAVFSVLFDKGSESEEKKPKYFERFNIPLEPEHSRMFYVEYPE